MKVGLRENINFGRALSSEELNEYVEVRKKAREILGQQDKSILIVPDSCLPQSSAENTGMGHLASKDSGQFFDLMKAYLGINTVEVLPPGQLYEDPKHKALYRPYEGSTLSLGNHQINAKLLTTSEYGSILDENEFDKIVEKNTTQQIIDNIKPSSAEASIVTNDTIVNFENVVEDNSSNENALRRAFDKFENSSDPKVSEIKKRFDAYKTKNADWLEPKGIYEILRKRNKQNNPKSWSDETDKNLYNTDFDSELRKKRIENIKGKYSKEIEFYKFKQFMADEHLALGKEELNKKSIKLFGDCPINFSPDEVWANPKAFKKDSSIIGWGFDSLDYDNIKDENSESAKLLKRKVGLFAQRYDGIRFDASWLYVKPKIITGQEKTASVINMGNSVLNMIEKTLKEVKGKDFDLKNLIHEFEAHHDDFAAFEGTEIIDPLKDRVKIYSSLYMNTEDGGWGYNDAFSKRLGKDTVVMGPGNHDPLPLRQLAELKDPMGKENMDHWKFVKEKQIPILADILKLDAKKLASDPVEFVKAKFADTVAAKNNMVFYIDVFGKNTRFNSQFNTKTTDYRYKISDKFESDYHKSLQEGYGFNIMDSFEKNFKAKGYDKTHNELYNSIVKFRDILTEKGVLTEKEANETIKLSKSGKTKWKYTNFIIAGAVVITTLMGAALLWNTKESESKNSSK